MVGKSGVEKRREWHKAKGERREVRERIGGKRAKRCGVEEKGGEEKKLVGGR